MTDGTTPTRWQPPPPGYTHPDVRVQYVYRGNRRATTYYGVLHDDRCHMWCVDPHAGAGHSDPADALRVLDHQAIGV